MRTIRKFRGRYLSATEKTNTRNRKYTVHFELSFRFRETRRNEKLRARYYEPNHYPNYPFCTRVTISSITVNRIITLIIFYAYNTSRYRQLNHYPNYFSYIKYTTLPNRKSIRFSKIQGKRGKKGNLFPSKTPRVFETLHDATCSVAFKISNVLKIKLEYSRVWYRRKKGNLISIKLRSSSRPMIFHTSFFSKFQSFQSNWSIC